MLGGTKAGNGAWALAWVDTIMEVPASEEDDSTGHVAAQEAIEVALAVEVARVGQEVDGAVGRDLETGGIAAQQAVEVALPVEVACMGQAVDGTVARHRVVGHVATQ